MQAHADGMDQGRERRTLMLQILARGEEVLLGPKDSRTLSGDQSRQGKKREKGGEKERKAKGNGGEGARAVSGHMKRRQAS